MIRKLTHVTSILCLVILVHELGHCFVALFFGLKIEKFAIGFGPTLFSFAIDTLPININLLPFGGYNDVNQASYEAASLSVRTALSLAGIIANIITAVLVNLKRGSPKFAKLPLGMYPHSYHPVVGSVIEPLWIVATFPYITWKEFTSGKLRLIDALTPVPFYTNYDRRHSWLTYFGLTSVLVAGFNFLPIFPLDGGKLTLIAIEAAGAEKPLLFYASAVLVVCAMIFVRLLKRVLLK